MINWPDNPRTTVAQLNEDIARTLIPQLEVLLIKDVVIGTTQTLVAHGLGAAPQSFFLTLQSDARVWRSAPSDDRFLYLTASASVTVDIQVVR